MERPARPDAGWEYNRMGGVRRAIEQRSGKSSPVLFSALTESINREMKIIDIVGWAEVAKAMDKLAKRNAEWFPQGFNGIHAVSNPEFFAATREGAFYFSNADELVSGFKPASLLVQAMEKAKAGEMLSFHEEYAVETLWHEIMHNLTSIRAVKIKLGKESLEEGLIQMASRYSYPSLLNEMGGTENNRSRIIENGYAYPRTARNLVEMSRLSGIDSETIAKVLIDYGQQWRPVLTEKFSEGLNIKQERIQTLYGHAVEKPLQDFIEKIRVLARNAPRSIP